jgi:hypothetical protein
VHPGKFLVIFDEQFFLYGTLSSWRNASRADGLVSLQETLSAVPEVSED